MPDQSFWEMHDAACARGDHTYIDPQTGFMVFTRVGLLDRGRCCGAGCRHCPFGHESVKLEARTRKIQQAAWLTHDLPDTSATVALLFWSGGKDGYLAYRRLIAKGDVQVVLLTTFDARTRMIAHQEYSIDVVVEQAIKLGVPLIGVPLHSGAEYVEHVLPALDLVPGCTQLCFGDLHLEHIREWREKAFGAHPRTSALDLVFPLWQSDYGALLQELEASGATSIISAVAQDLHDVAPGDRFDAEFIQRLPPHVDPFGENGEFHTRVILG